MVFSYENLLRRLDLLPQGGISGVPLKELSTNLIRHIYRQTNGKYVLIGLGGVFTAEDAYEKIKAGASLVQIITGFIYIGPTVVEKNKQKARGTLGPPDKDVSEAVGKKSGEVSAVTPDSRRRLQGFEHDGDVQHE